MEATTSRMPRVKPRMDTNNCVGSRIVPLVVLTVLCCNGPLQWINAESSASCKKDEFPRRSESRYGATVNARTWIRPISSHIAQASRGLQLACSCLRRLILSLAAAEHAVSDANTVSGGACFSSGKLIVSDHGALVDHMPGKEQILYLFYFVASSGNIRAVEKARWYGFGRTRAYHMQSLYRGHYSIIK